MRAMPEPKGSSTTPAMPLSMKRPGKPRIVSDPNHVAKVAVITIGSGKLRPARAKSLVFLTRMEAYTPMPIVTSR